MIHITYIDLEHVHRSLRLPFPVMTAGYCTIDHDPPQRYRYEKFELTLRYESTVKSACDIIDGVEYHTPFPSYVLKRPGMTHEYSLEDNRRALFFIFSPETESLLDSYGVLDMPPVGWFGAASGLSAEIETVMRLLRHSQESYVADELDLAAFNFLQKLYFMEKGQQRKKEYSLADRLKEIASYLESTLNEYHSMRELATRFGFSERGFYRSWKEFFEVTPQQYIIQRKIKRAEYLLTNTTLPIMEIARQLSFDNINYFSTCFHRVTGISPRSYRQLKADRAQGNEP